MFGRLILMLALLWSLPILAMPEVEYFTQESKYKEAKISPDGEILAIKMPQNGRDMLALINIESMQVQHVVRFTDRKEIGDFYWVNQQRLMFQLLENKGWLAEPLWYGEWYAVNADGSKATNVYGYRAGEMQTGTRLRKQQSTWGIGQLIDPLLDDDKHVLMASTPMGRGEQRHANIIRLNVYNGRIKKLGRSPVQNGYFLADDAGKVRIAAGTNIEGDWQLHYRSKRGDNWRRIDLGDKRFGDLQPLAFADRDHIYLMSDHDSDISGLYKMNVNNGQMTLLYQDQQVEPSKFHFSPDGRVLYALEVEPDFPNYIFIRGKHQSAQILKGLMAAFPGQQVSLTSQSADGNLAVVAVYSDQQPTDFYLYDHAKAKVRPLVASRDWVDAKQSSLVEPIQFSGRDGYSLSGYLTLPPGVRLEQARQLPLVVNPHGGPRSRDFWRYNSETQLLASRGFAVLQVNFRGSAGFGSGHMHAGDKQWGGVSQHDIIDGTRHVIEQGIADPKRICLYGASFGGYSALQSAILEPELFACAVGSMGVYDLEMMFEHGDIQQNRSGINYLEETLGTDKQQLRAFSPVHNVDKLKAPLLLLHGEEDERTPIEQVDALKQALDKRKYPYQYFEMDKEGHGLADPQTRAEYYRTVLSFLEEHTRL
ncbi:S9 family peptidase [Ferrimonas senticii]|uniref:S9 family peptidase n=1 Tax=Ferrimonas senticii TaxID=394566 RepID=UPI000419EBC8|nr:S9 family peptidase [Ferrimonas senticii]